jgi:hypothetical protein
MHNKNSAGMHTETPSTPYTITGMHVCIELGCGKGGMSVCIQLGCDKGGIPVCAYG